MLNLKLLNMGLGVLNGNEFMALYVISNIISPAKNAKPEWHKIYIEAISDKIGKSYRQTQRIIDSLVEQGFIRKWVKVLKNDKKEVYFMDNFVQKSTETDDKNVSEVGQTDDKNVQENGQKCHINKNVLNKKNVINVLNGVNAKETETKAWLYDLDNLPF